MNCSSYEGAVKISYPAVPLSGLLPVVLLPWLATYRYLPLESTRSWMGLASEAVSGKMPLGSACNAPPVPVVKGRICPG